MVALAHLRTRVLRLALAFGSVGLVAACSSSASSDTTSSDLVSKASAFAGIYADTSPMFDAGRVWALSLHADGTFSMHVQGLYMCSGESGFTCPTSSVLGQLGWTRVTGQWAPTTNGATLQPGGSSKLTIQLGLVTTSANKLAVKGKLDGRDITGELDITALYAKDHPTAQKLDGTWLVDSPTDRQGKQLDLSGNTLALNGQQHFVAFDAKAGTFQEWRGADAPRSAGGFSVAGSPTDPKTLGVVVLEDGVSTGAVNLSTLDASTMELLVNGQKLHLTKR